MQPKLFIFIGLLILCSSVSALKMTENIKVDGYGQISSQTDQDSVYDRVDSYGDNQIYSRKLTSGDFEQAKLETTYAYRNSKNVKNGNVTGRYEAGLRMPDGIHHSIWVKSNGSINTTSTVGYVNGDLVVGNTYFNWDALNASLSESIKDYSLGKAEFIASTAIQGNFSLKNEMEESQRMSCTAGVLLELLDATEMRGSSQYQEVQGEGPRMIIMDGKSATPDVQASYLQKDAADLIASAVNEQDDTIRLEKLNKALKLIDEALTIHPNDATGYHNKGAALYGLKRISEAREAYEKSIKLDNTNPITIFELAQLLFTNQQYRESIVYFNMGLPLDPNRDGGVYWRNLAQAHYHLRNYIEAEKAIDEYIARTLPASEPLFFKALNQYENQSYKEAIESYEKAFALVDENSKMKDKKKYANRCLYLGDAYLKIAKGDAYSENFEKAKKIFDEAIQLDPDLKDTVETLIQSMDQKSAGSSPTEIINTLMENKVVSTSNVTRPANGLESALR